MQLALYRGVTTAAEPLVRHYLQRRVRNGKEDSARLGERLGLASAARPAGPVVWAHAASVGESLSMLSLVERLRAERPGVNLLMTTGTVTSARILAERLPEGVIHQYVPVDRHAWVSRFLEYWRPDLALWVESEFWPNMLCGLGERGIPAILLNARVSPRSYRRWLRMRSVIRSLLANFDLCLAQSAEDAAKLERLGAASVRCPGNLKFAAAPLPCDDGALPDLTRRLGGRAVWLASSTHPGEDTVIAAAHGILRRATPDLLAIIVPRHPARGPAIAEELRRAGHTVALRSAGEPPMPATDIYIADTMGELGLFYRLAPVVFIGGSLIPHGGQNPLEPAQLDCALVHGPHMSNFRAIMGDMEAAGATAEAADAPAIAAEIGRILGDDALRAARAAAARDVALASRGVLDRVMRELDPYLDALPGARPVEMRHARA